MELPLNEARAIVGLADVLYDFLPGSGFGRVADKARLGNFWSSGSKKPAIIALLRQTLEYRRSSFQNLILEIVRESLIDRERKSRPITKTEIDDLNGHMSVLGYKIPELWEPGFRASLGQSTTEQAREHVRRSDADQQKQSLQARRSQDLLQLKEEFLHLNAALDRNKAGLALEQLLKQLFELFELKPRQPFRIIGEQVDGSFELDGEIYLVEAKWKKDPLPVADLLAFRGKIERRSTFTRGVFVALNDVSSEAKDAITRGKALSFFIMSGHDLMMILCEAMSLTEFLRKRIRLLAEEGRVCILFSELSA